MAMSHSSPLTRGLGASDSLRCVRLRRGPLPCQTWWFAPLRREFLERDEGV